MPLPDPDLPPRRRFLRALAGAALGAAALPGCGPPPPFSVAYHSWIGYESLALAEELGMLPASAILREGRDSLESIALVKLGKVDAAALTLDEVLKVRASGTAVTIVLVFDDSAGADAIVARPEVHAVRDLAGRRVGYERSTVSALVLAKALEGEGLRLTDIRPVEIAYAGQQKAWRNGEVDAMVTFEPMLARLERDGARRIFDSRQAPDLVFDVLAVRSERLAPLAGSVQGFLAAHFRALEHIRTHRQDALYRMATRMGLTAEEAQRALAGIDIPDVDGNRRYLAEGDGLMAAARTNQRLLLAHGLLEKEDALDGLVDAAYLPRRSGAP